MVLLVVALNQYLLIKCTNSVESDGMVCDGFREEHRTEHDLAANSFFCRELDSEC